MRFSARNGRRILAVVRGSAVNHDGRASGLTVPNGTAQREVMRQALAAADVRPRDVTLIEAHGTGTPLGDPIEVGAIRDVYGTDRAVALVLGAVKPNIGHLEAAAGIAGLVKVVLALGRATIPPIAGLEAVNSALALDFSVLLPTAPVPWPSGVPRLASVSAFGMSGTNAHVVVEAGPPALAAARPRTVWNRRRFWIDDAADPSPIPATAGPGDGPADADLLATVQAAASAALGRAAGDPLPIRRGFFDAGMDSLSAVDLVRRLVRTLGLELPPTVPFDHPDVEALTRHVARLLGRAAGERAPPRRRDVPVTDDVAIIGMACRFPDAASPEELWDLLLARRVAIREVPPERWDADAWYAPLPARSGKSYTRAGAFLESIDRFDPDFFGISPREAETLDPQQRLALEVSVEALARAGRAGPGLRGSRTGVFLGISERGWLHRFRRDGEPLYPDAWSGTGAVPSFAAGRIAHALGLSGPTLALDTTCSTSLVAVHLAANALRNGECDTALAGGVSLQLLPDDTASRCALGALSPSGRCHVFDARADGYVRGEGAGMVVLRRRSDAEREGDPILAVIRGSAVNHDGASAGLTVPNGAAQETVLREALSRAGVAPSDVGFLEAHGTGTALGDPVEVRAALAVYGDRAAAPPLHLGALKANLGHLELAAGVASLVKAVLVLRHGLIPGHPDLETVNPHLALHGATIPTATVPWPEGTRLAAVSAFGLSGTNAHVLLERGLAADEASPPVVTFRRRRIWPAEPAASTPPITYGVRWEETEAAAAELPREVVLLGADRAALGDALRRAGIRVRSPAVHGPLDATLLAIGTHAATVPAGTHVVFCTGAAWSCGAAEPDPDQTAIWGLARCVAVERPEIRTTIVDLGREPTGDGLLAALRTGAPEVAIRGAPLVPRLERVAIGGPPPVLSGTWIVTGGLGAIGARVAAWLAASGAARLVLVGRRTGSAPAPSFPGVDVELVAADVADEQAVALLVARFPPDGIVHAAGTTLPQALSALDPDTVRRTLGAKVQGARHLDRLTRGRTLQGFVLISSIAATWGSRDLGAYAAANAFLDGLAERRRAAGETATSVAFGPWAGGGMIDAPRRDVLERGGFRLLDPATAINSLARALASGRPHTVVVAVAAPPRPARIAPVTSASVLQVVVARAREVLRLPDGEPIAADVPLADRGFDSLMATELKAALLADGIDVPLGRLLGGPSPNEIAMMSVARASAPDAERMPSDTRILLWTHAAVAVVAAALASAVWALVSLY